MFIDDWREEVLLAINVIGAASGDDDILTLVHELLGAVELLSVLLFVEDPLLVDVANLSIGGVLDGRGILSQQTQVLVFHHLLRSILSRHPAV